MVAPLIGRTLRLMVRAVISPQVMKYLANRFESGCQVLAMIAHSEPVNSWGLEPCGRHSLLTTTCVSAGGGAPRPTGTGRGVSEVEMLLNSALNRAYGDRHLAGLAQWRALNEQRPSPEAAPPAAWSFTLAPSLEGDHRDWPSSIVRMAFLSSARISGDLGTAST